MTASPEAFKLLQAANAFRKQPDDTGLEAAIEKYKQAIDLDPHFAAAHSHLAMAYCRLHALGHYDSAAALDLADENAKASLNEDPNRIEGHLAMMYVFQHHGDTGSPISQISEALRINPPTPSLGCGNMTSITGSIVSLRPSLSVAS